MATNIEQIFRSFVVSKFREIQEEQQQQQDGGGKVEGQPNGDTIPAEQANPSDDTGAGAGSRQNDQIVQKIEEVLSGALDTELQCKSDKNTVKNSTKSTKRSSTGEDEIPKKKTKKNKKHKSKKKKKKKKKRKKEKKHKKQPKESKLSTLQALDTTLESETMEVLEYSEASLQSVAQEGATEAVYLASDVTTIPVSANQAGLNAVKVAHMSVAVEEVQVPEATEKSVHIENVKSVETSLELGEVEDVEARSKTSHLTQIKNSEMVVESEVSPRSVQEQIVGHSEAVL
ncbi:SON protein, partial [Jacana jacana]|nr:SON protein [Jacana jacana]